MLDLEDLIQSLELTCKDAAVDADSLDRTTHDLSRRHEAAEGLANRISNLRTSLGNALANAKAIAEIVKEHPGMLNTTPGPGTSAAAPHGRYEGKWQVDLQDAFDRYRKIVGIAATVPLVPSDPFPDASVVIHRLNHDTAPQPLPALLYGRVRCRRNEQLSQRLDNHSYHRRIGGSYGRSRTKLPDLHLPARLHTQRQTSGRQGSTLPLRRTSTHATGLP